MMSRLEKISWSNGVWIDEMAHKLLGTSRDNIYILMDLNIPIWEVEIMKETSGSYLL